MLDISKRILMFVMLIIVSVTTLLAQAEVNKQINGIKRSGNYFYEESTMNDENEAQDIASRMLTVCINKYLGENGIAREKDVTVDDIVNIKFLKMKRGAMVCVFAYVAKSDFVPVPKKEMEIVVEEKLKEFPDKNEYLKKVSDMKELTKLYKKMKNKELVSKEEKRFLYEEESEIIGFGYEKDPRIEEIREYVEILEEITELYNIEIKDISFNSKQALEGNIKLHYGSLELLDLKDGKGVILPEKIDGDLNLWYLINADGMVFPKAVNGSIFLNNLPKATGLTFPKKVKGSIYLKSLNTAKNIFFPNIVKGEIFLNNLTVAKNIIFPHHLYHKLELNKLVSAQNLIFPPKIDYSIEIYNLDIEDNRVIMFQVPAASGTPMNWKGFPTKNK